MHSFDLYIGSFTKPHPFFPNAKGEGIVSCSFDTKSGKIEQKNTLSSILNPSYLALDPTGEYLISTSENIDAEGAVHLLHRLPQGKLQALSSQPSGGLATCHVAVSKNGKIYASSYVDGVLSVYPVKKGKIETVESTFRYPGKSVNPQRQERAHAHQAVESPNRRWLYVNDLGSDRLWRHTIDGGIISSPDDNSTKVPAGYGPRHLLFHPTLPLLYVLCELNAHLLTYEMNPSTGDLSLKADQATLPHDWNGQPSAAAIRLHPSGKALYLSNRNHNSISVFLFDDQGNAKFAARIPSGGETPRDFGIDPTGNFLIVANQDSNVLAIHKLDPSTSLPTARPPEFFPVSTPVCILIASPFE